jgi:CxxC-x17-CxxC domain-containing protein
MKNNRHNSWGGQGRGANSYTGGSTRRNFGGSKELHKARCSKCKTDCTVPFKPNGRKPVMCSNCFRGSTGGFQKKSFTDRPAYGRSNERSFDKASFDRRPAGPNLKREMDEMNKKLDRILYILNKSAPSEIKEVYEKDLLDGPISFDV